MIKIKLLLEFELAKNQLDIDHRRIFMHIIKKSITEAGDGKYYQQYYGKNRQKDLTFAVYLDKPRFETDLIRLSSNKIKLFFSTSDKRLGMIFWNAFIAQKGKKTPLSGQNEITMTRIIKLPEQQVQDEKIYVKMLSPLVIREHHREGNKDRYHSVASEHFKETADAIIKKQLERSGYDQDHISDFHIIPVRARKTVITHYGCKIEASIGIFELQGNPLILDHLLKAGIGSRHNEGLGMCQILNRG